MLVIDLAERADKIIVVQSKASIRSVVKRRQPDSKVLPIFVRVGCRAYVFQYEKLMKLFFAIANNHWYADRVLPTQKVQAAAFGLEHMREAVYIIPFKKEFAFRGS